MLNFDKSLIKSGDKIAVGLSGGKDSVALLHFLSTNAQKLNIKVLAINVEHGLRGQDSINDSDFCVKLCKQLNIDIKTYKVDALSYSKDNNLSLEEGARKLRYDCYFDSINNGFCDKVALGHHLGDLTETFLFNILRGSALSGGKGITPSAYDNKIVRPLLYTTKDDITEYITANNLPFVYDKSNDDTYYARNYIRKEILPIIKQKFPNVEQSILRFTKACASDDDYLYTIAQNNIAFNNDNLLGESVIINTPLDYPIFSRAVVLAFKHLKRLKDFEQKHVDALYLLSQNQSGKKLDLIYGVKAIKEFDKIVLYCESNTQKTDKNPLTKPFSIGKTTFNGYEITVEKVDFFDKDNIKTDELYFDLDKLPSDTIFRLKQDGDKINKFGGGCVLVKKFLTDKKIPATQKRQVIVLAKDNLVFCLPKIDISSDIKIDKSSQNIVKLKIVKQKEN